VRHRYKPRFRREEILAATGLLNALRQILPETPGFPDTDLIDALASGDANHHTILSAFRSAFSEDRADPGQIEALAKLVHLSLSVPDAVENAWMTCFFERRPKAGPLWSQLSPDVKRYIETH